MNPELHHFLTQGPRTVKDLARLTELSTSTIYKAINSATDIKSKDGPSGKVFWIAPNGELESTKETVSEPALDTEKAPVGGKAAEPADSMQTGLKAERRGRKATGAGKTLWPMCQVEIEGHGIEQLNPRRKGSHGYNSLAIVIDNPGITTEGFVAKGGRLNDLRWDLAHGNVEAR